VIRKYGQEMTEKWTYERLFKWIMFVCAKIFHTPFPWNKRLYVISHFSIAELRHIKDHFDLPPKQIFVGKGQYCHIRTTIDDWKFFIIDSFAYFWRGLEVIGKAVDVPKIKIEWDGKDHRYWIEHMEELKKRNPHLFWRYAMNDSVILIKAWNTWRKYFHEEFGYEILNRATPTIASVAADVFRLFYLKEPTAPYKQAQYSRETKQRSTGKYYRTKKGAKATIYKGDRNIRYAAMRAYAQYDLYKGKPIVMLDFVGHYNRCGQLQPLPYEDTAWKKWGFPERFRWDDLPQRDKDEILRCEGFVETEFEFSEKLLYPCLPVKSPHTERLTFPTSSFPKERKPNEEPYDTAFTIYELKCALEIDPNVKLTNMRVCGFVPTAKERNHALRDFLKDMERRKDEAHRKYGRQSLQRHIMKLIANAMVGKFLQKVDDWGFEETLKLTQFLRNEEQIKEFLKTKPKPMKEAGSTWCPEWGALILGRARGLLGLAFNLVHAITGHTDSMVCYWIKPRIKKALKVMRREGARLEAELFTDKLWINRSAVYVFWKGDKAIKSVHHGYPCTDDEWANKPGVRKRRIGLPRRSHMDASMAFHRRSLRRGNHLHPQ